MSGLPLSRMSRSSTCRAGLPSLSMPTNSHGSESAHGNWAPFAEDYDCRMDEVRLDKWLWAARFYKTRSLASAEIGKGRVQVNGQSAKPARALRPGDRVELRQDGTTRTVVVLALSDVRGPAPVAQTLYEETPDSVAQR